MKHTHPRFFLLWIIGGILFSTTLGLLHVPEAQGVSHPINGTHGLYITDTTIVPTSTGSVDIYIKAPQIFDVVSFKINPSSGLSNIVINMDTTLFGTILNGNQIGGTGHEILAQLGTTGNGGVPIDATNGVKIGSISFTGPASGVETIGFETDFSLGSLGTLASLHSTKTGELTYGEAQFSTTYFQHGVISLSTGACINISNSSADEDAGTIDFTLTTNTPTPQDFIIGYNTTDGSATTPSDYIGVTTAQSGFTMPSGVTSWTHSVVIIDDTIIEGNEMFTLTYTDGTYGFCNSGNLSVTGTIIDNDSLIPNEYNFTAVNYDIAEGDGDSAGQYTESVDVIITRSGSATIAENVDLTLIPGTSSLNTAGATASKDYNYIAPITIAFSSGETSKTISIPIQKDTIYEYDETIDLQLGNYSSSGYSGTMSHSKITILDDDVPDIWIDTSMNTGSSFLNTESIYEGTFGTNDIVECLIQYSNTNEKPTRIMINKTDVNGTANQGTDFMGSQTLWGPILPGGTTSCNTNIYGDENVEADETFDIQLDYKDILYFNSTIQTLTKTITILNDDTYTISIGPANSFALEGTNTSISATVSINPFPSTPSEIVTVDYSTIAGSASTSDFTTTTGTLTIDSSTATPITITVPIIDDNIDEDFENFTIELANPSSNTLLGTDSSATITIMDNDNAGIMRDLGSIITNESGSSATIQYKLDSEPTSDVTITFSGLNIAEGTMSTTQLTFTPSNWDSWQSVVFTGVDDTLVDGPILYQITSSISSSDAKYQAQTINNFTVTNNDDDSVGIHINDTTITEGNPGDTTTATLNVTFSAAPLNDITITYNTQELSGEATSDVDFTAITNGTFVFTAADFANSSTVSIPVSIIPDSNFESNETFQVVISTTDGTLNKDTGLIQITDDDQPLYCIDTTNAGRGYQITESGGDNTNFGMSFPIQINRIGDSQTADEIQAIFVGGGVANVESATGSNDPLTGDFNHTPITINFAAGESSKDFNFLVVDDTLVENTEGLIFSINNTGNTVGAINTNLGCNQQEITIVSDDLYEITITPTTVNISEAGGITSAQVSITPTPTGSDTATIDYTSADGTATGGDYTSVSGTFTFTASNTTHTINIPITNDNIDEPDETFTITLNNPVNATIANNLQTITIEDNDNVGILITDINGSPINTSSLTTNESGSSTIFYIALQSQPTSPVTIEFTGIYNTEGVMNQNSLTFDQNNWNTPQNTTITGLDDTIVDGNITYTLAIGMTSNDIQYAALTPAPIQVTNIDNDQVNITISDITITEGNPGDTITASLTVTLSAQPITPLTVDYSTQEITGLANGYAATIDNDFISLTNQSLSFSPGGNLIQTISIDITSDLIYEFDQQFDVVLSNAVGGKTNIDGTERGTITIVNDDIPTVTFTSPSTSRAEGHSGNNAFECTITLDPNITERSVYLSLTTTPGTATTDDYTGVNITNMLLEANTPYTCAGISIVGDNTVELHELFALTASYTEIETGNNLGSETLNLTILNDDADCYSQTEIPTIECLALVDLYNNTNGTAWTDNNNWLNYNDIASWHGISISGTNVTAIELSSNNIEGSLVTSIGNFSVLTSLNLSDNVITGNLPPSIGNLTNLTVLDISNNGFTGNLPDTIGNTSLIQLFINNNVFFGSIPTTVENLVALTYLYADHNAFSGSIPVQLYSLSNLIDLVLNHNQLTGELDTAIGGMNNMVKFHVNDNQLECFVPNSLGSFPRILVNLSNNMFIDPTSDAALNTLLGGGPGTHIMMPQNPSTVNCGVINVGRVETLLIDDYDSTSESITYEWVVPTGNPTQYHIEAVDMATYAANFGTTWSRVTGSPISVPGTTGNIVSHTHDITTFIAAQSNNANDYFYRIIAVDGQGNEAASSDIGFMIGDVTRGNQGNNYSYQEIYNPNYQGFPDYNLGLADAHLTALNINFPTYFPYSVNFLNKAANVTSQTNANISEYSDAYNPNITSEPDFENDQPKVTLTDAHRIALMYNFSAFFIKPSNTYYLNIQAPLVIQRYLPNLNILL